MSWRIPLSDLRVSAAQQAAVQEVLASGWLSMGPRVADFETRFAAAAGVPHAVAVSSGTAALQLALQAVGVGPGDEVVLPSLTFVACANVVRALGAVPVFADVCGPDWPLIDPASVRAALTPRTRAVLAVHYGGALADVAALAELGVPVVEDAAHAVGPVTDGGEWLPVVGEAACFSFFANKNLALGEGGMVACRSAEVAERVRLLRAHGMTTGTWDRHRGHASEYDVVAVGGNFRLTEVQAALGAAGLDELPAGNGARRARLREYEARLPMALAGCPATSGHLAVAVLPRPGMRPAVREALAAAGIQSSFHYPPIHRFTAYREVAAGPLPRTEEAAERLITLPLFPWLTSAEVGEVCDVVASA